MFANRVEGEKYTASIHAGFLAHEERERIKRQQAQCMNTPKRMLDYLKSSPMAQKAFDHQGEERVRQNIDYLFQRCSEITPFTPDNLLGKLDFQPTSTENEEWLAALFAVMRTIILLHERLDFETITPLEKCEDRPEADLKATRRGVTYAIEVCRTKEEIPRDHSVELGEHIAKRYKGKEDQCGQSNDGKKKQLRATMEKYDCSRAIFVVAFDSCSAMLYSKQALRDTADCARVGMDMPNKTHVLIFTSKNWNEPSEEDQHWAIEPALPD